MEPTDSVLSDPGRLAALTATGLPDSPSEEAFDRLTRLVQRCLPAPVALVSLVDAERQFFKSQQGLPEPWSTARQTPLSYSFCQHVVTRDAPLVIEDARVDSLVCDNLAIEYLGVVAYLGVPLRTADGHVLGSLCAIESQPRAWTGRDLEIMEALAEATMAEIDSRWRLDAETDDLWVAVGQGRALVRVLFEDERPRALLHRGRVADANRSLLGLLGRSREAVVGTPLGDALGLGGRAADDLADALVTADRGDRLSLTVDSSVGAVVVRLTGVPAAKAVLAEIATA